MGSILIIGSYGILAYEMINKLSKENWRIFTLTSDKKSIKPEHVFEQYIFEYDSDSTNEVIASSHPEVILFLGAYDPLYQWDDETVRGESLNYVAGLSNLLMNASIHGVRHFIYVSSHRVFEEEYAVDINEDMPASPKTYKGMAISQGENLAMHFNKTSQMEVTIVRIAHMYGIPTKAKECTDIYSKMCMKALTERRLKVNAKKAISGIYIRDAIEALYLIMNAQERKHSVYHISSMEENTEAEIAQLIKENIEQPIDIIDQTVGLKQRIVLSNKRICEEFHFKIRYSYKTIIPAMISYMKHHKLQFLRRDDNMEGNRLVNRLLKLLRKILPFLETSLFFIPFFMLNNWAVDSTYFSGINFYMLYVLLFSVVHGRQQAIYASLLSVLGYCYRQMYTETGFSLLISINTYIWIAQLFVVGMTVGHLKDKFRDLDQDKSEKIDFLTERLNDITVINNSNTKIKNYYAEKLISSTESIGHIYSITSKLDKANKGEVLFAALDTLTEIMQSHDVSIYSVTSVNYCRLSSASSEKARSLGKSIAIDQYPMIFNALENRQVFVNRTLDHKLPMMASALYDDNIMRIVIFLWDLPYENMTLYHTNLLTVVGALIYNAVVRDADYFDALAYKRFIPETRILQEEAFHEMVKIYQHAGEKGYTESCILYISSFQSIMEMDEQIHSVIRDTDYVGVTSDGSLAVLLTNTNENEYIYVRDRLKANGIHTYLNKKI